ncbi:hypothetical protein [Gelria sp. Kuro-4]|uniref:hypothetical protein n=1 Tax=Gelria sp. Kuro-4 TaxID=2796927 RepID=UPI001BEDB869|nr:hypothetical protein [Gelria sp. Kuro-4]BCV24022.1 hypothetical protein kuro4_07950 [Gelria sp. Kuro-4]
MIQDANKMVIDDQHPMLILQPVLVRITMAGKRELLREMASSSLSTSLAAAYVTREKPSVRGGLFYAGARAELDKRVIFRAH